MAGKAKTVLKVKLVAPVPVPLEAVIVKEAGLTAAVGVPLTTQELLMLKPGGKLPEVTEQFVIGPPLETTLWLVDLSTVSTNVDGL